MRVSRLLQSVSFVLCCVLLSAPLLAKAPAQPLADRVPADAVRYIGWRGVDAAKQDYQGSHLQGLVSQTPINELISEVLPTLLAQRRTEFPPPARMLEKDVSALLPALWHRPWALSLSVQQVQGQPMPAGQLMIDAGPDADAVRASASHLVALALQSAGFDTPPMQVQTAAGRVTISFGRSTNDQALADNTLADDVRFKTALAQMPDGGLVTVYLDARRMIELASAAPGSQINPQVIHDLGLDGLEQVVATMGFDGRRWQTHLFIHAPAKPGAAPRPAHAARRSADQ